MKKRGIVVLEFVANVSRIYTIEHWLRLMLYFSFVHSIQFIIISRIPG